MPIVDLGPNQPKVFHPENPAFDVLAAPTKEIRKNRARMQAQCVACFKAVGKGKMFDQCSRCKLAHYCSKECQHAHWPTHKKICQPAQGGPNFSKLVSSLVANETLRFFLETCLVLLFNLHHKSPAMKRTDMPLVAEKLQLLGLLLGAFNVLEEDITGMLQINHLAPNSPVPLEELEKTRAELWTRTISANKKGRFPMVLVDFVDLDRSQSFTSAIPIRPGAIQYVKMDEPVVLTSALTGIQKKIPLSADSCLERLNLHIRHDLNNQLRLHMKLREEDKEVIIGTRTAPLTYCSRLFQDKMRRENTYELAGIGHKDIVDLVHEYNDEGMEMDDVDYEEGVLPTQQNANLGDVGGEAGVLPAPQNADLINLHSHDRHSGLLTLLAFIAVAYIAIVYVL
ncbi:hypothetical protein BDQ17DRAFT_1371028 [Cyathus striatus]|nr:hypothetical protein BDQ17DRAFT_1371028 [Cyathus striatus]